MQKKFAKELIDRAVRREEEAMSLYTKAAAVIKRPEVKKFFLELAEQEMGHKETLLKIDPNADCDRCGCIVPFSLKAWKRPTNLVREAWRDLQKGRVE